MADRTLTRDDEDDNGDRTLTKADVEAIAEKVNQKLFESLGFDISTPAGRLEAAGAMRMTVLWYRFWGRFAQAGIGAAVTLAVGYVTWRFFGWGSPP